MSGPLIVVPKYSKIGQGFSRREKIKAMEHPGRRTDPRRGYQSAASWIADRIGLRKDVILCSFCRAKFNPRRHGYRRVFVPDYTGKTDGYTVNGQCDSCKQETPNAGGGTAFVAEEVYSLTHIDPSEARRNARAAAKSLGTWQFLQKKRR